MSEDKRSVMETKGSYYVSLPASWAQRHGLEKGSKLRLYYSDQPVLTVVPSDSLLKFDGFTNERLLQLYGASLYFTLPMNWCKRYHVTGESDLKVEKVIEESALLYSI